ncbi:MAG TPA: (2Fe-2S)-binding protein [Rhizomicrobium sp.]|nr:(2Fe-2S)-binding protein [Rhizomicrobium sp.]
MTQKIRFRLNGKEVELDAGDDRILLWALRTDAGMTGPKYGCGAGFCGACTVLVEGSAVRSCSTPLSFVAGKSVTTIEGLAHGETLHPLQQAFIDHGAFQCGYCTSGMILTAYAFLKERPHPTRDEIAENLEHNFCRCGAHNRILDAVEAAAKTGARS